MSTPGPAAIGSAGHRRWGRWRAACLASVLGVTACIASQSELQLLSASPPIGATNAAPGGGVVLVFNQPMDTTVPPLATIPGVFAGNHEVALPAGPIAVSGSWGADRRTLVLRPDAAIPLGTPVTWTLNPEGASRPLRSAVGQPLPTLTGGFRIAPDAGGDASDDCPPPDTVPSTYTVSKLIQYRQHSSADPVLLTGNPAFFGVTVQPAAGGPEVLGGSVTAPDGSLWDLAPEFGQFRLLETYPTLPALDAARPPGAYTLRIHRRGSPERVIPLTLPPAPGPVPKVANYDEAQSVDAARDFTLRWNLFTSGDAGALVRVILSDESGGRLFLAPDACGLRTLDPAADSIVIPAGLLRPGFTYQGQLVFALNFHKATHDAGRLAGNGFVQRVTSFSLRTRGSSGEPPRDWCAVDSFRNGSYLFVKRLAHCQIASDRVAPASGVPAFVGITVQGPAEGPEVTGGALTLPDGTVREIPPHSDGIMLAAFGADEPALDLEFPPGDYALRFTQAGFPEQNVSLVIPAAPAAIPRILNFAAAQDLDASAEFTLEWEPFTSQPSGSFIQLSLFDRLGNLVFLSPNACASRSLSPGATSVTIPAGTFRPGEVYEGLLVFGAALSPANQRSPGLPGNLRIQRSTTFSLRARDPGGTHQGIPADLSALRIRPDGIPEFRVSGPAHASFRLQRASELSGSNSVSLPSIQLDAAGTAVVEDAAGVLEAPAWYRAWSD
ncbi:MAG: hypothetical protein J0L84_21030 [Verrucomicrobia bacterium]|nr:hypothetical protein [Verrucomicrobiota bacterium]